MYFYIWEFHVHEHHKQDFAAAYGSGGEWVKLFRQDPAYLGTTLLQDRDDPLRFVTIDSWQSREAYLAFRARHGEEFNALDAVCEAYTLREVALGEFGLVE